MKTLQAASRIFTADKVIESRLLNTLGAQVVRAVVARAMRLSRRPAVAAPLVERVRTLDRDGLLVWPDFLPANDFRELEAECRQAVSDRERMRTRPSGPNACSKAMVRSYPEPAIPALHRFLRDPRLLHLFEAAERRPVGDLLDVAELEDLTQGKVDTEADPQSEAHSDIFFSSHKAWFYLTDVERADGPLAFVLGSHRLSPARLYSVYAHSVRLGRSADPSRRIGVGEMKALAARERILTVPRNTLVVADTCGYHRRLQGEAGHRRLSIHLELRGDPFRMRYHA